MAKGKRPVNWSKMRMGITELQFDGGRSFQIEPTSNDRMLTFHGNLVALWTPTEAMEIAWAIAMMARSMKQLRATKRKAQRHP